MIINQALSSASDKLAKQNFPASSLDAEVLLSSAIKRPKEFLYTHPEFKLTTGQLKKFNRLISQRAKGEPVAYLRNLKEFYGLEFYVDKNVLIPRPETELMVDEVLQETRDKRQATSSYGIIADIGTGSGCIAITLKKYLPKATVLATEISSKALAVARKNAKKHAVKIEFYQGNLLSPLKNKEIDILVANLPYGDKSAWSKIKNQNTAGLKFEPKVALYAKRSGLGLYQELLKQIADLKFPPRQILIEIDPGQTKSAGRLIKKFLPKYSWKIKKDLSGQKRLLIISTI
ncbi:MAG: protein-(glutamine-N5) methyltransferase, release factor-specific [Candidatus Buchananbacteria bacterium RIFCSPLOWO2_02_FULL_46_11b]|uniref:peptide chain release factor N(5)-glutamine methyltransferase n=1 Tax=Candidatus Buchananbacteria bacterium RIFCSPLOWO2_02_FULL_46_11b TaxID=1797548 RepID=A0A1G1YYY5_9BACT|nr:MAG: protein-(glutamine-N5) methyltransferase, release factor-specific [Candidatus Buchananbacteria bacterium RIFCSPLOWO2_02_FULL_46_11b]